MRLGLGMALVVLGCTTRTGGDEVPPGVGGSAGSAGSGGAGGSAGVPSLTYPLPETIDLGGDTSGVAVADVDGDGYLDLAALVKGEGSDRVELVLAFGDAEGMLNARFEHELEGSVSRTSQGSSSSVVAIADLDADGRLDLATASGLALGSGARTFSWVSFGEEAGHAFQPATIAELDTRVVVRGSAEGAVERCDASGSCQPLIGQAPCVSCAVEDLVIADVDGDSKHDVVGGPVSGALLWQSGDGWQTAIALGQLKSVDLEAGDIDQDGVADVVAQTPASGATAPASSEVWLGTPGGTAPLTRVQTFAQHGPQNEASALADASFDSCLDLVRVSSDAPAVVVRLGSFDGETCSELLGDVWQPVAGAPGAIGIQQLDINGDATPEWVLRVPPLLRVLEIPPL